MKIPYARPPDLEYTIRIAERTTARTTILRTSLANGMPLATSNLAAAQFTRCFPTIERAKHFRMRFRQPQIAMKRGKR
jgi:hypothetical protein